jgi:hypothetical protein
MIMTVDEKFLSSLYENLAADTKEMVDRAVQSIVAAKGRAGKVVVVTGSGPNLHEGVTTLIAELINKGIIDGVTTSSAVVAHEMAGVLDEVKRVNGRDLGFNDDILPRGDIFELSLLQEGWLQRLQQEMILDIALMEKIKSMNGSVIIKAAGNMAYPLGLYTENLAKEILLIARSNGMAFETVAGAGADPRTMLGAAYAAGKPLLVTVPQLIGGGWVGMAIGDSIPISERCNRIARMMQDADVIIESAVVLTQEIHDGPFETYTGHGIWSQWEGYPTYHLKAAWDFEHQSGEVQKAIDQGMPKTKLMKIPFRMEMSGFCRLENSIPVIGDIGGIWPIMAWQIAQRLGVQLDFMSYPQQTPLGLQMRKWIVDNIQPVDKKRLHRHSRS